MFWSSCRIPCRIAALAMFLLAVPLAALAQQFESRAPRVFMVDAETGTVLYAKDADAPFPPASLAKLMAMEVAFHALSEGKVALGDLFYISDDVWRRGGAPAGGATMFAEARSSVPLEDLIKGTIVQSANDGAMAIAEGMAGSQSDFARLMNQRAKQIGLMDSVFTNPAGLPEEGQQVTARDLVRLAMHLWKDYPQYFPYFALPEFTWNKIRQLNRNPLIHMNIGVDGMMTGATKETGFAIVATIARDGKRLFLAMSGLETDRQRSEEARRILEWGSRAFERRLLFQHGQVIAEASVFGGTKSGVAVKAEGPVAILVPYASRDSLRARLVYDGPVMAPIREGTEIGKLKVWIGDTLAMETPVFAAENIGVGPLHSRALDALTELLTGWIRHL